MKTEISYPVRFTYLVLSILTVAGILFQVFLVGLSLLGGQPSWETHIGLGHMLGLFPLLMLALAYFGRLPGTDKRLIGLFIGVYIFQAEVFAVIRGAAPMYAALHPVLALILFATGTLITWRAWALVRARARTPLAIQDVTDVSDETDKAAA